MIDPKEKSTGLCPHRPGAATADIGDGLLLDGRLALVDPAARWLAVADLHFGYEANRRREGGLWPMWGMESIAARLEGLMHDWQPDTLILVGDVVDGSAAPEEAVAWLAGLYSLAPRLVLVEGNHDRGPIRREFEWVESWQIGDFFFEHGHHNREAPANAIRVRGHLHPSVRLSDGAGMSLKLPCLCLVKREDASRGTGELILPAFSPWAGGGRIDCGDKETRVRRWACSPQRVFEV